EVFMELGNIYRKLGALELAISKYYMVMNASINIKFDQLEKYKNLSMQAKLEIAATHNERGERNEAYRMYQHLYRLDLKPVDRLRVHYHMCYLLYELGDYQQAVAQLKLFLDTYPITPHAPEIRYLLAKSYDKLNRKPEALREVVAILQRQSSVDTQDSESADYWKRRMGNELANEFYEKGDFRSALAIYQALARYSDAAQWRWPAVHQIGLCFERLGLPEKAKMAYAQIANPEEGTVDPSQLNDHLRSLQEMAKWRLEHLNWEDDLIARLSILKAQ
ncbi:MAG: tetratricopeptide repeat protein, partial [Verrucomicrobiota bacterium]